MHEDVLLISRGEQLFNSDGGNIGQIDAAVIIEKDAIIGSKKTRLNLSHVKQLEETMKMVELNRSSVESLKIFQGKHLHGEFYDCLMYFSR